MPSSGLNDLRARIVRRVEASPAQVFESPSVLQTPVPESSVKASSSVANSTPNDDSAMRGTLRPATRAVLTPVPGSSDRGNDLYLAELASVERMLPENPERRNLVASLRSDKFSKVLWTTYLSLLVDDYRRFGKSREPRMRSDSDHRDVEFDQIRNAVIRVFIRATRTLDITANRRHDEDFLQMWISLAEIQAEESDNLHDAKGTIKYMKVQRIGINNPKLLLASAAIEQKCGNIEKAEKLRAEAKRCTPLLPPESKPTGSENEVPPNVATARPHRPVSARPNPSSSKPGFFPTSDTKTDPLSSSSEIRPADAIDQRRRVHSGSANHTALPPRGLRAPVLEAAPPRQTRGSDNIEAAKPSYRLKQPKDKPVERPESRIPSSEQIPIQPSRQSPDFASKDMPFGVDLAGFDFQIPTILSAPSSRSTSNISSSRNEEHLRGPRNPQKVPASTSWDSISEEKRSSYRDRNSPRNPHSSIGVDVDYIQRHPVEDPAEMYKHELSRIATNRCGSPRGEHRGPNVSASVSPPSPSVSASPTSTGIGVGSSLTPSAPQLPPRLGRGEVDMPEAGISRHGERENASFQRDQLPMYSDVRRTGARSSGYSAGSTPAQGDPSFAARPSPAHHIPKAVFPMPPPENTISVNSRPYLVLELAGKGGSSKVYKVLSHDMKIYALKRVKVPSVSRSALASYANEIQLLQRLHDRPTIIQLYDAEVLKSNGTILLVMEYGDIDLAKLLTQRRGKTISANFRKLYWQQMLEAVQTIHEQKIVHGDLKPANFLHVAGTLKLIDFGIAKAIQTDDTTKIVRDAQIGTPNYMSPEALMAEDDDADECDAGTASDGSSRPSRSKRYRVGRASDIWSLGCILYQMVFGRTPFAHIKNTMQKLSRIQDPNYPIPFPDMPVEDPHLLDVLKGCLQREPEQRMSLSVLLSHPYITQEFSKESLGAGGSLRAQVRAVLSALEDMGYSTLAPSRTANEAAAMESDLLSRVHKIMEQSKPSPHAADDKDCLPSGLSLSRMTPTSSALTGHSGISRTR